MANLGTLAVQFKAKTKRFFTKLGKLEARVAKLGRGLKNIGLTAGKFAAVGLAGLTAGIVAVGVKTAKTVDRFGKLSDRLGISTEAISSFGLAFEKGGVSFDQGAVALQRMTRRIGEASVGTGEAQGALKELGLNARLLANLPVEEQFFRITKAFEGVKRPADRVRLAFKLFDTEGVGLIQVMKQGEAALRATTGQANRMGLTVGGPAAQNVAKMIDTFTVMKSRIVGVVRQIVVALTPSFTRFLGVIDRFIQKLINANGGARGIANTVRKVLAGAFKFVASAVKFAMQFIPVAVAAIRQAFKFMIDFVVGQIPTMVKVFNVLKSNALGLAAFFINVGIPFIKDWANQFIFWVKLAAIVFKQIILPRILTSVELLVAKFKRDFLPAILEITANILKFANFSTSAIERVRATWEFLKLAFTSIRFVFLSIGQWFAQVFRGIINGIFQMTTLIPRFLQQIGLIDSVPDPLGLQGILTNLDSVIEKLEGGKLDLALGEGRQTGTAQVKDPQLQKVIELQQEQLAVWKGGQLAAVAG